MFAQRELSVQIVDAGGDYIWTVKDNQATVHQDIETLSQREVTIKGFSPTHKELRTEQTIEKQHGHEEQRTLTASSDLNGYLEWSTAEQVLKIERPSFTFCQFQPQLHCGAPVSSATADKLCVHTDRTPVIYFQRENVIIWLNPRGRVIMSKKKHHQFPASNSGPTNIKQRGLQSFRQNDLTSAIVQWSQLNLETEPTLRPALAEAHFRRASITKDAAVRFADLQRAIELLPNEGRFWYHLGLAHHRADQLDEAIAAYDHAREVGYTHNAWGFVRGLAAIERDPQIDLDTLTALSPADRSALFPIAALLRNDPQAVLDTQAGSWFDRVKDQVTGNSMTVLWRGLAFIALKQSASAIEALAPTGRTYKAGAEAARAYYHGLALMIDGQREAALKEWQAAATRTPTPRLQAAVAADQLQQLKSLAEANRWAAALQAAQQALKVTPDQLPLLTIESIAHNRLASDAIGRSDWPEAIRQWQALRKTLESHPKLGPIIPVLHNLAVAHEKLVHWSDAAESWNELIAKLPKRQTKKSQAELQLPLPLPEFRAWLRRHVLDCYKHANQPELAITHYRNLVKTSPDDLDLRLELAETLLANQQELAARNELKRIITKDARQIEARLMLAEIHHARGEIWAAEEQLRAAVEIDPTHEVARRGMSELMIERGNNAFNSGRYIEAKKVYLEALQLTPDDIQLLIWLGNTELALRNLPAAYQHFDAALSRGELHTYVHVFDCWAKDDNMAEAKMIITRAEAAGFGNAHFYVDLVDVCFKAARFSEEAFDPFAPPRQKKKPVANPWEQFAHELLQKAEATSDDRVEMYRHIVGLLGPSKSDIALSYAKKLTELTPDDAMAWMQLAVMQGTAGQTKLAKETLHQASRLARKQGDSAMLEKIEQARQIINNPLMGMFSKMGISLDDLAADMDFDEEDLFR
jgi:tetratricopeptide (TPR) repeat protein